MLKAVLILSAVLIFPVFINFDFLIKNDLKRLWFGVHAYGFIKLIGGYAERIKEGFAIHYSRNGAIIVKFQDVFGAGEKVRPLKDYHFVRLYSLVEVGSDARQENALVCGFLLNYFGAMMSRHLRLKKPYLKMRNDVNVYIGEKIFDVYFSGTLVFNFLMVVLSLIKISTEKIIYAFGKGK